MSRWFLAGTLAVGVSWGMPARALTFNFTTISGDSLTAAQAAAFGTAAAAWSAVLVDPVTVQVGIGFRDLGTVGGSTILGVTGASLATVSYDGFKLALNADAKSAADAQAVANLPLTVQTAQVIGTTAQLRAIGVITLAASDGTIEFTTHSGVTYAPTRAALDSNSYDLIGVAEHEIGHLLGFISSVDQTGQTTKAPLDLFRYFSSGVPSFTPGQAAYFSLDGGVTHLASFAVGGAGQYQASHWLQGTGALMDPALAKGTVQDITALDVLAQDVIGWDVAVPEPATAGLLLLVLSAMGAMRRRAVQRTR